ncbi:unnamed protein product [Didymodactylos carnosus]|uniref:Uncharacterized protein n=1 Tax=Didymodactylos carnosus TaxID=1234261 RepID=A0A815QRI3_9BILA|nr:unnamed protein product [Didymodactylos carnosus]CAF4335751.1 unnamed protein product [Didymodactylos carnosus]
MFWGSCQIVSTKRSSFGGGAHASVAGAGAVGAFLRYKIGYHTTAQLSRKDKSLAITTCHRKKNNKMRNGRQDHEMKKLNEKTENKMNELGKVFMDFLPAITSLFEMVVSTALSQSNVKTEMKQQLINDYTEKLKMITQPILAILKSFAERIHRSPDFGKNNSNDTGILV